MIAMFHVTKAYGKDAPVLSDINLNVGKAEFVFLTGPSGAGKSTLLKLMFLAERPTRGQILIAGKNIARVHESSIAHLRRNIGVVFQDFKLLPNRTVVENVGFSLDVVGVPRDIVREKSLRMLRRVGLEHKAHVSPVKLSGGEQQRVSLCRALVNDPAILLADEPTGNLDPSLTFEIMNLLCDVNARGTTVIVATHDAGLIAKYQKRTLRIDRGVLVSDDRAAENARTVAMPA